METMVEYITKGRRDAKRPPIDQASGRWGERIGVMIAFKSADGINIGFSLRNKKERDKFDRKKAIQIAIDRAISLSPIVVIPINEINLRVEQALKEDAMIDDREVIDLIPSSIRDRILRFTNRCNRYYKDSNLTPFWKHMETLLVEEVNK